MNYFTFSLFPDHKKQNHLLFPPFLSPFLSPKWENRTEKRPISFLFYFFAPHHQQQKVTVTFFAKILTFSTKKSR